MGGADHLERSASVSVLPASEEINGQFGVPSVSTAAASQPQAQSSDAMAIDEPEKKVVAASVIAAPRAAAGHPARSKSLGNSRAKYGYGVTGLETSLASMTIRKVKPLPARADPTTPKRRKTIICLPIPAAPKKARSPSQKKPKPNASDVLPVLPRKSILKRKPEEEENRQSKKARIVDAPAAVIGGPKTPGRRNLKTGFSGGKGTLISPSKYAAARRRRSTGGTGANGSSAYRE